MADERMPNNKAAEGVQVPVDLRFLYDELLRETPESRDRYGTHLSAEVGRELIERIATLTASLDAKERELELSVMQRELSVECER